jgi:hypothetical protein
LYLPASDPFSGDATSTTTPGAANGSQSGSYSDDDKKDLEWAIKLIESGKKNRDTYNNFDATRDYFLGKQWRVKRPKYRSSPVANICWPIIQSTVPILTDTSPSFSLVGRDPSDYDFGEVMSKCVTAWWNRRSMDNVIVEACIDLCQYRFSVAKILWNDDLETGEGDVEVTVIDPRNVLFPDFAEDFNKKCPWVVHLMKKTVGEIKRKYPDSASEISGTGTSNIAATAKNAAYSGTPVDTWPITRKDDGTASAIPGAAGLKEHDQVEIAEVWVDDYATEERDLAEGKKETVLKWPNGKIITLIPEKRVLLQVKPNPYLHGQKPFIRFIDHIVPRQLPGVGEIEPIMEMQDLINKNLAAIYDIFNLTGNPVWVIDDDSGVDADNLTNSIGAVITKKPNSHVERLPAPDINPGRCNFHGQLLSLSEQISGIHDVTQGRKPVGITAAEAINSLQEAAQTRIRLKERQLRTSLAQLGYQVSSLMMQFYRAPRVVRLTGDNNWPEYFEFYIREADNNLMQYVMQKYTRGADGNFQKEGTAQIGNPSKGEFDISVVSGASLPWLKEKRGSMAMDLFKMQVIDDQELLDSLDWPKKEAVLKRMQDKKAAEQQAAQQAAPQPGAPK